MKRWIAVAAAAAALLAAGSGRAGSDAAAVPVPAPAAGEDGSPRALRKAGLALLAENEPARAVYLLRRAALDGDYPALVALERLRRAGGPNAPSLADMIAIETALAEAGDPVAAWRLVRRHETGEGVDPSAEEAVRWLKIVARKENAAYPKSAEAAFRLCEIYARGEAVPADETAARGWCAEAARRGHAGAAFALAQMKGVNG
ncbi:SEL1-like repeat protein [Amphiplicatus metriothermophilus]|uniref:Sel1 repeat-containing protein n=1 Tax=Amphiplicatus metriothermophilus TaxID=1519374 RepID=A0A239PKA9_9PROT|nr:SEL1-like repeat protein [Amphiplicatus metriothermophilus]MBB5517413.1 TPR repeat protein [Amphiplicatus metriothermophilus]SNT68252.1 Sel1 repeat-containing protein [Amphiplicatus metriothermophilus]